MIGIAMNAIIRNKMGRPPKSRPNPTNAKITYNV